MNRIRKGDTVFVIAGKNKGQHGEVTRVTGDRVFVQNVNMVKRHTKPNPQLQQAGGIVECRPLSKTKHFRVVEVLAHAAE